MPHSLVTGAAGFLGSHLTDRLLADGHSVLGVDNLLTGRMENLALARRNPQFIFRQQDATKAVPVRTRFTHVWHLASPASPPDFLRFPVETLRVGAEGTRQALERARRDDADFLLASTSEVYGDPTVSPQPEDYWGNVNPVGARSAYNEGKRYAEALTTAYSRAHGLRVHIARIFNTYGPRMRLDDGRVMPNMFGQALRGEALTIYGDGKQTRSFCYYEDLIEGLVRLMAATHRTPLNIGYDREITVLEFAQIVQRISARALPIVHKPLPQDDPKQRRPDLTLARRLLHWEAEVPLEEGLRRTWESLQVMPVARLQARRS